LITKSYQSSPEEDLKAEKVREACQNQDIHMLASIFVTNLQAKEVLTSLNKIIENPANGFLSLDCNLRWNFKFDHALMLIFLFLQ
jgi:hypothetical protein